MCVPSAQMVASDGVQRSGPVTVNILVVDANDNAPTFAQVSFSVDLFTDMQPGETVLQVMSPHKNISARWYDSLSNPRPHQNNLDCIPIRNEWIEKKNVCPADFWFIFFLLRLASNMVAVNSTDFAASSILADSEQFFKKRIYSCFMPPPVEMDF